MDNDLKLLQRLADCGGMEMEFLELARDAERYRWLKSRTALDLRSERQPNTWTRMDGTKFNATHSLAEGGTQHAPADNLDAMIDAAMVAASLRDA